MRGKGGRNLCTPNAKIYGGSDIISMEFQILGSLIEKETRHVEDGIALISF